MSRPENVMITGARGFVGSTMVRRLRREFPTLELTLVGHRPGRIGQDVIHELDISNDAQVSAFIRKKRPTLIIHLAAVSAISSAVADMRRTWNVNGLGPINMAMALMEHLPDCHLVFVSSAEVYGKSAQPGVSLTEQHLLQPANPYASAKSAADLFIQEAAGRGLNATVMRPFNHIGPAQSLAFALPSFCAQIVKIERGAEPVLRVGSLEDVRDFLHVDDVVEAYLQAARARETLPSGAVFNVASGMPVRMQDLLDRLVALSDVEVRIELDSTKLRGRPPTSVVGDATKLRATLGWEPHKKLDDALMETLEHWRAQP